MMDDKEFGCALVSAGLIGEADLQAALEERRLAAPRFVFLWDILIRRGLISQVQVDEVLAALQNRRRYCGACKIGVLAPQITHEGERCGRCGGPISWNMLSSAPKEDWSEETVLMMEDAPEPVREAGRNRDSVLGKFVLVEEAGRGGCGVVYKAWDLVLGQHVALKLLRATSDTDPEAQRRRLKDLLKEARNSIRLRHPHIVPTHDAGRIGAEFFISMDFIEGEPLARPIHRARRQGAVSPFYENPSRYLEILRDVAFALHHAHTLAHPIVHCDLKPANVLVDTQGRGYVMDFGIAQSTAQPPSEETARNGDIQGTPAYIAPEQVQGERKGIGPWTDLYAWGAMLYELLAGRTMFDGQGMELLFSALKEAPKPPLARARASGQEAIKQIAALPYASALESLCLRCLSKTPSERPRSALEVATEIEALLGTVRKGEAPVQTLEDLPWNPEHTEPTVRLAAGPAITIPPRARQKDPDPAEPVPGSVPEGGSAEEFLGRVIEQVNRMKPAMDSLELVDSRVSQVELLRATRRGLIVFHQERSMDVPWSQLTPRQLVALARDVLQLELPEHLRAHRLQAAVDRR